MLPLNRFTRVVTSCTAVKTATATATAQFASTSDGKLVKTALYDLHLQIG